MAKKQITILGATGTIGQNTLELIDQHQEKFSLVGLTAHCDTKNLAKLAMKYQPACLALSDDSVAVKTSWQEWQNIMPDLKNIPIGFGEKALVDVAAQSVDLSVVGIVGIAALKPIWHALLAGHHIALANKEAIVAAGHLILPSYKNKILPIDSEHNAIFQCLLGQDKEALKKIILTASGGPFLRRDKNTFSTITPDEAVMHPRWQMGKKISVDSATLFNKGLEMIEAAHLFALTPSQIDIVIHPESFVHSFVMFGDGSYLAQMGRADMKIPISFALAYPKRLAEKNSQKNGVAELIKYKAMHFETPDETKFLSLRLAREALVASGSAPLVLNSSNEWLVEKFLAGAIDFTAIEKGVAYMLENMVLPVAKDIHQAIEQDKEIKIKTNEWLMKHQNIKIQKYKHA